MKESLITQLQFSLYVTLLNVLITTEIIHLIMMDGCEKNEAKTAKDTWAKWHFSFFQFCSKFFSVVPPYTGNIIISPPTQCLNRLFFRE